MRRRGFWDDAIRILRCHLGISVLLILQCVLCFFLMGTVSGQVLKSEENVSKFHETIGRKTYYNVYENLDDNTFYKYMREDNYKFREIAELVQTLQAEPAFSYMIITGQPISIWDRELPAEVLDGYEEGFGEYAVWQDENGRRISGVKSFQVSSNVFSEFELSLKRGREWTADDFIVKETREIPVILGSRYDGTWEVGDHFSGVYLEEEFDFVVIGILTENAAFSMGENVEYCDRYILFPHLGVSPDQPAPFNKMRLLQQASGFIISDQGLEVVREVVNSHLQNAGVPGGASGVGVTDMSGKGDVASYEVMTDAVLQQLIYLLVILVIFVIISISCSMNGLIRDNYYQYGVFLLSGASRKEIRQGIFGSVCMIVFGADMIAFCLGCLFSSISMSWLLIQIPIVLMVLLACIAPICHIRRLEIADLIKGRE